MASLHDKQQSSDAVTTDVSKEADAVQDVPSPSIQFSLETARPQQNSSRIGHRKSASMDSPKRPFADRSASALLDKIRTFGKPYEMSPESEKPQDAALIDPKRRSHAHKLSTEAITTPGPRPRLDGQPTSSAAGNSSDGALDNLDHTSPTSFWRSIARQSHPRDGSRTEPSSPVLHSRRFRPPMTTSISATAAEEELSISTSRRPPIMKSQSGARLGLSDDESDSRVMKGRSWRRASAWTPAGRPVGVKGEKTANRPEEAEKRPRNLRRFASFVHHDNSEPTTPSGWRSHRAERAKVVSAAKWQQVKTGLRMLGQRRKAENRVDQAKSAELLAEMTAGAPAALLLASMFQRDEHGSTRIPILLEQLKVKIPECTGGDSDRHQVFRVEMEYGNGLTRMKWVIYRSLRDFVNLHTRYKVQASTQKYVKLKGDDIRTSLPHFPRSTFSYLRGIRGDGESDTSDADNEGQSKDEATSAGYAQKTKRKDRPHFGHRRKSSAMSNSANEGVTNQTKREAYSDRQRKKLELYLQQMIRYLIFRPESNRLCKFLELSALGIRLAAEGSYHGKEGHLVIKSGKGVDFRRAWTPSLVAGRHAPKWFVVRHSYIVCVDSPEAMNIYDVFLVDANFRFSTKRKRIRDQQKAKDMAKIAKESAAHPQHHTLKLYNSERRLKLLAKTERQLRDFQESILFMCTNSLWSRPKRFDSFAPIRENVFAQWLVDGRDYMWNASRAISMAKDVIYIHDWWLSPELYMRRPAAISQKWRLDRLLQRKAQEGVKVFVIMYRNINSAIPIDSEYSKFSLLDLHPNIFVQRSPNQFRQNTFFWAHHEKLCLIDHMVAFIGGIDLCFGRWDTPQHSVVDDKMTGFEVSKVPKDADHCQLWPGKDYSNPRVQDFYALDHPYEEMYDRTRVPRMPWHDIHMQIVGQPARDLTRHFVQRWNYILRQRKPTRPTPFLLPPPDLEQKEIDDLNLRGTCEIQVLRSACEWSLGTPGLTECSIQKAYLKMIEQSDHFVYIENQFFISSCEMEGTRIENQIGDALVERIIRAAKANEAWRAVIVIPLMPGFQNTVDQQDGTSVRLIMQCQYRSICRGEGSIFERVRAAGYHPADYIQFYSLRSWGMIGPNKQLVTEQLYIHAKCMVVDDRVAIIGSANINERSMLGSRDSECAAIVRDTDMLQSTMNGQPYVVGRFPHTLRMRLMREHLGLDVDQIMEDESKADSMNKSEYTDPKNCSSEGNREIMEKLRHPRSVDDAVAQTLWRAENSSTFNGDVDWEQAENPNLKTGRRLTEDPRVTHNEAHRQSVDGLGHDQMAMHSDTTHDFLRDTNFVDTRSGTKEIFDRGDRGIDPDVDQESVDSKGIMANDAKSIPTQDELDGISGPPSRDQERPVASPEVLPEAEPKSDFVVPNRSRNESQSRIPKVSGIDKDCMKDPLLESFMLSKWHALAEHNTKLFRDVFRCMPDNEVKSWKEYKEFMAYSERFAQAHGTGRQETQPHADFHGPSGPPGEPSFSERSKTLGSIGEKAALFEEKIFSNPHHDGSKKDATGELGDWAEKANREQAERQAQQGIDGQTQTSEKVSTDSVPNDRNNEGLGSERIQENQKDQAVPSEEIKRTTSIRGRRRGATMRSTHVDFRASDDIMSKGEAESLMNQVQGHLVIWPHDWLMHEEQGGNWLYSIDGLAPLEIYN